MVVVDKPVGPTSFSVLRSVQRALGAGRGGHAGTLDPAASGVLVAMLGEATKLSDWVMAEDKRYLATVQLGAETTTLDAEGEVTHRSDVDLVSLRALEGASATSAEPGQGPLSGLVGTYSQVPPVFSAIKRDGRSLMSRARAGEVFEPEPRIVTCRSITVVSVDVENSRIELEVASAKGFYVRSLARDLAKALGTHGHLVALRRTQSGRFAIADAVTPEALTEADIMPLQDAVGPDVQKVHVTDPKQLAYVAVGRPIPREATEGTSEVSGPSTVGSHRGLLIDPDGVALALVVSDETGEFWKIARGLNVRRGDIESR